MDAQRSFPPALRDWVARARETCDRAAISDVIARAAAANTLWTADWATMPLPGRAISGTGASSWPASKGRPDFARELTPSTGRSGSRHMSQVRLRPPSAATINRTPRPMTAGGRLAESESYSTARARRPGGLREGRSAPTTPQRRSLPQKDPLLVVGGGFGGGGEMAAMLAEEREARHRAETRLSQVLPSRLILTAYPAPRHMRMKWPPSTP